MKIKLLLTIATLGILSAESKAQNYWKLDAAKSLGDVVWEYDFIAPVAKSIQEVNVSSESTPNSEGFLPKPTSGTVAVRTYDSSNPNADPAGFIMSGSCAASSLTMIATSGPSTAPTASAATSRFAAYGFANATRVMSIHFNMALSVDPTNTNANWYFMIGGNSYPGILTANSNNMTISNANYAHDDRIFGAYRLIKSSQDGNFAHTTMQKASSSVATRTWAGTSAANLAANTSYKIDIYCNNSTSTQYYIHNNQEVPLAAGKYVIYVDGSLKGPFDKIEFTTSQNLRSFMIMSRDGAQSGTGNHDNSASLTISNFKVVHLGTVSALPVTLTNFSGKATNAGIALNWQTSSEENNSHFIVNRSANGKDFSYLTREEAKGTAANYNYVDRLPLKGSNYYQLVQVDKNATVNSFSKYVVVNYGMSESKFAVIPLSNTSLRIVAPSEVKEVADLIITDISGKVIYKGKTLLNAGSNIFEVAISAVSPGVYVARLATASKSQTVKVLL